MHRKSFFHLDILESLGTLRPKSVLIRLLVEKRKKHILSMHQSMPLILTIFRETFKSISKLTSNEK